MPEVKNVVWLILIVIIKMSMASTSGNFFYKIAGASSASYIKWNWTEETFIKLVQRIILGNIYVFCVRIFVLM